MSGVIYKYTCPMYNHSYIGSTKRYWEKRLEEHSHVSALTGKPLNGMQMYAPLQHLRTGSCMVRISRDDFEIIGREKKPIRTQAKGEYLHHTAEACLEQQHYECALALVFAMNS